MKNNLEEMQNVESVKSRVSPDRLLGDIIDGNSSHGVRNGRQLIKAICSDSRRVVPGAAFFAIPGRRTSGEAYLDEALERGAKVVVSESSNIKLPIGVTNIKVNDARSALARFSKNFYNSPDEAMSLIGITGTNGKTTVSTLTRYLLEEPRVTPKPFGVPGGVSVTKSIGFGVNNCCYLRRF